MVCLTIDERYNLPASSQEKNVTFFNVRKNVIENSRLFKS